MTRLHPNEQNALALALEKSTVPQGAEFRNWLHGDGPKQEFCHLNLICASQPYTPGLLRYAMQYAYQRGTTSKLTQAIQLAKDLEDLLLTLMIESGCPAYQHALDDLREIGLTDHLSRIVEGLACEQAGGRACLECGGPTDWQDEVVGRDSPSYPAGWACQNDECGSLERSNA